MSVTKFRSTAVTVSGPSLELEAQQQPVVQRTLATLAHQSARNQRGKLAKEEPEDPLRRMATAMGAAPRAPGFASPRQRAPSVASSVLSHRSTRSDASRMRLENHKQRDFLSSHILKEMQMKARTGGRQMSKMEFTIMSQLAGEEADRLLSNGPALGATTLRSQLSARKTQGINLRSPRAAGNVELPPINTPRDSLMPHAPSATTARERKPLRVNVAGKDIPLSTMICDKIMQRGAGGAHQVRYILSLHTLPTTARDIYTYRSVAATAAYGHRI